MSTARLVLCAGGIYASFLTWALVQERLTSTPYYADPAHIRAGDAKPRFFRHVIFLNTVQSTCSALAALCYIAYKSRSQHASWASRLGLSAGTAATKPKQGARDSSAKQILLKCFQCALMASIGSPFGYAALRYIDYPTQILGKSCKLVPVMLMNIILYRRKFAFHKYLVVATVTLGISLFMLYAPGKAGKHASVASTQPILGITLLLVNLLMDGAINSTQDEVFHQHRISGTQMMFFMNAFATVITACTMLVPFPHIPILNPAPASAAGQAWAASTPNELAGAIDFIRAHPAVLRDILSFSVAGAIGQLFIFDTLENFGSLVLVTITVTRKLFTMLLSLVVFNHSLTTGQWVGVITVFAGIGIEAQVKRREAIAKKRQKLKALKDGDLKPIDDRNGVQNGRITPINGKTGVKDL